MTFSSQNLSISFLGVSMNAAVMAASRSDSFLASFLTSACSLSLAILEEILIPACLVSVFSDQFSGFMNMPDLARMTMPRPPTKRIRISDSPCALVLSDNDLIIFIVNDFGKK